MKPTKKINGVYAITPDQPHTAQLLDDVAAALTGGVRLLQYRNKQASDGLRLVQAGALAVLCRNQGATFIINDDARLAATVDADGVHLGGEDMAVPAARQIVGHGKIIGVSCYDDLARGATAIMDGVDYLAFGSFFASPNKPAAVRARLALLAEARRQFALPLVAIGGIDRHNAPALMRAGANAIAVISALFAAQDISIAARDLVHLFETESHDFA
jgi:thiamine-phosphate pyrophosphorylase